MNLLIKYNGFGEWAAEQRGVHRYRLYFSPLTAQGVSPRRATNMSAVNNTDKSRRRQVPHLTYLILCMHIIQCV